MNLNSSDQYEDLTSEWQFQMITILKKSLLKQDISVDKAKAICEDFTFDFAMLHDQGNIKLEKAIFKPVICFQDEIGNLNHSSEDDFDLHSYALGNVDEAFEA